ncbi:MULTISPECIES: hypothetical protein [Proteiniphilum]|jgi:hypothetical protein|uniref:hypothetical protein n=1 Tax=Proteiniphilum TaxID=294702 RepID=UPI001EEAECF9|nr:MULTISPECIES: hypothetical protein [Proteiniphilum]MDD2247284.1 hypothetical protein [Proteiniphilum sp.]ULB34728.1 hypothetical protein KDN43_01295 [Proteiniphilum propionicum]
MKKTNLFLAIIGMTLLLTSCLGDGNSNYSEASVAYIAMDNASSKIYGRTLTGRLITSAQMQGMTPGTFQFLRYSWEEEYGEEKIGDKYADKVVISGDPKLISRADLIMADPPVVETPDKFLAIDPPYYAADEIYLGDHWLFQYAYEYKKGQTVSLEFYKINKEGANDDEVFIEIHLVIDGTPEAGASTTSGSDIIALNMAPIRAMYEGTSQTNTKDIKIQFRYYLKNRNDIVDSNVYKMRVAGD